MSLVIGVAIISVIILYLFFHIKDEYDDDQWWSE